MLIPKCQVFYHILNKGWSFYPYSCVIHCKMKYIFTLQIRIFIIVKAKTDIW
jgi:hypothetical protein